MACKGHLDALVGHTSITVNLNGIEWSVIERVLIFHLDFLVSYVGMKCGLSSDEGTEVLASKLMRRMFELNRN
jgi:hypothetical protein